MATSFVQLPSPRSEHVAAVVGSHGVTGAFTSSGLHSHASPVVAPQGPLVHHGGRLGRSDPFVVGVRRGGSLVALGGQVVVRCSSPGSSSVPLVVYQCFAVKLGSAMLYLTASWRGGRVCSVEESVMHINMLEMKAVSLALATFLPQLSGQSVVLMSDNASVVAYLQHQGGMVSRGPVSHGLRGRSLDRAALLPLCVPSSGPEGLEAGCAPVSVGPPSSICLPDVCSTQAGSCQGFSS